MRQSLSILLLVACGTAQAQSDLLFDSGFETGSATLGSAGGVVPGPDGVRLVVDEGALAVPVTFRIAADATGAPPLPPGIETAGAIYAVTPHGTGFDATAVIELPVPAGSGPVFLIKGEPGATRWQVIAQAGSPGPVLRSGVESLSYFALGRCTPNTPAGACPADHRLSVELLDFSDTVLPIDQDDPQPVVLVAEPTLLVMRLRWTRPSQVIPRTDTISSGSGMVDGFPVRTPGFAFDAGAPDDEAVNGSFERTFGVVVTPTLVPGAADPNRFGRVRNLWGQARYGSGGAQGWNFSAFIPIRVFDPAGANATFAITSQPQDATAVAGGSASFTVATDTPPGSQLSYQWYRSATASGPFQPIARATGATYTLDAAEPGDDGSRFYAFICSTRPWTCLRSDTATLTVAGIVPPVISEQPASSTVFVGATARFTVRASATQQLEITWERSDDGGFSWTSIGPGVAIAGGSQFDEVAQLNENGAQFRAEACNVAGADRACVLSNVATLGVDPFTDAPVITRDPQPQWTVVGGSARFDVQAGSASPAPIGFRWQIEGEVLPPFGGGAFDFAIDDCSGRGQYGEAPSVVTLRDLTAGCDGKRVRVRASNGFPPDALSLPALLTVAAPGAAQPRWTQPQVLAGFDAGLGRPVAEPLLQGAVVNDDGDLRLLGAGGPGVPAVLATGVVGQPVVATRTPLYHWVLFKTRAAGTACFPEGGDTLTAIGLFVDNEGVVAAASPPVTLLATGTGPCIEDVAAAGSLEGVAFAAVSDDAVSPPWVGRFNRLYNGATLTWGPATLSVGVLAAPDGLCNSPVGFSERALAGPASIATTSPARTAVLAYEARPDGQPQLCTATMAANGTWSSATRVVDLGITPEGESRPVVAMDRDGNAVLAESAQEVGVRRLSTRRLAVSGTAWTAEEFFFYDGPVSHDLAVDPVDGRAFLVWSNRPFASTAQAIFASSRDGSGAWSDARRLLDGDRDSGFPRLTAGNRGEHLVTFEALDGQRHRIMGVRWANGDWQAPAWIQPPGGADARFAVAPRYWFQGNAFDALDFLPVFWRETDPGDPQRSRIMRVLPTP